jgi:hypothetical protein
MTDGLPDPAALGAAFEDFMHAMTAAAVRPETPLAARIRDHLGTDPAALPTTAAEFATTDPPNLQLAFDAVLPDAEVIGFDTATEDDLVARTATVSGAFVKELMRQAAVRAALAGTAPPRAADVKEALDELLEERSTLTRRLLGQRADGEGPGPPPFGSMVHALGAAGLPLPDVIE